MFRLLFMKMWTRDSSILLGGFFLTVFLIVYVWWPLAEEVLVFIDWTGPWWLYMDWLLVGIFLFMSLTLIARANLKTDGLIVFVGIFGGLAIESWGTITPLNARRYGSSQPGRSRVFQSIGLHAHSIPDSKVSKLLDASQSKVRRIRTP